MALHVSYALFSELLEAEANRARRFVRDYSLIAIRFPSDTSADIVKEAVSSVTDSQLRGYDIVSGSAEELGESTHIILLPTTDFQEVPFVARRLREELVSRLQLRPSTLVIATASASQDGHDARTVFAALKQHLVE